MTLAENEEHLVEALGALPPRVADHVMAWVAGLRDLGLGRDLDWSDSWSEEDILDARNASVSAFDEQERRSA
jgi:hypothetical protein